MPKITLATCQEFPAPAIDEPLRNVLAARGHTVISTPWNGPQGAFYDADMVLLRACWDYSRTPNDFTQWINDLCRASVALYNPRDVVLWNMNKRYLLELQERGTVMPETLVVDATSNKDVYIAIKQQGWTEAVAKPLVGQGGGGVVRLDPKNFEKWPDLSVDQTQLILQDFRSEISKLGETILVFFEGEFSHAVRRIVAPGEWRSNFRFGARRVKCGASSSIVQQAKKALSILSVPPLYGRVDGLVDGENLTVMELELVEPDLGFAEVPDAADKFVRHIEKRLENARK
jgi:glutathione synthase/RimK-type ligase-like ATP-grasp enzyme